MKADDPLEELDQLLLEVVQVCGSKDGSVLTLDQDTDELVFTLVHGELRQQLPGHRIKSDVGVVGWAIENGKNVIVNNPHQDWRFSFSVDQEFAFLTRSILCVPIHCGKKIVGVTELINKDPSGFTDADLTVLTVFAHIAAMVLAGTDDCPIDEMPDESDNIVAQLL
jgi:GAF domain-containing protein